MHGEFIHVWAETWQDIWLPLIEQEGVPDDIFCELYRELGAALKKPSASDAVVLVINDAIQLREAFDRALILMGTEIDLAQRDEVFDGSLAVSLDSAISRKEALEAALTTATNDPTRSRGMLSQALSELANEPHKHAEARERALDKIINDKLRSREAFELTQPVDLAGERALVAFLEATHGILEDLGGDLLTNLYFNLLSSFIEKYSLRYDLRRPCILCPTLPGVFSSLIRDLRAMASQDTHLDSFMKEFEDAVRDLRYGCTDGRIKTCMSKQFMLLEALGAIAPGVTKGTLGGMCDEIRSWPHAAIKESLKKLYGFASDYPGIRHGKNTEGILRSIEMRDMVAMSILLTGFTPYLSDHLNLEAVYEGS